MQVMHLLILAAWSSMNISVTIGSSVNLPAVLEVLCG